LLESTYSYDEYFISVHMTLLFVVIRSSNKWT